MNFKPNNKDEFREIIERYLSNWKWYILSIFLCLTIALINLRYSTRAYKIEATIRINENMADENVVEGYNKSSSSERKNNPSKIVKDEIRVLQSRPLIERIVNELNLNIQFFGQGKFMAKEYYSDQPLAINFLANDSIINKIDTTLTVRVVSKSKYLLQKDGKENGFGDKVSTPFGNIVITPNVDNPTGLISNDYAIRIRPVSKVISSYSKSISIKSGGEDSSIINISLVNPIRRKGKDIINKLIEAYNDQKIEQKNKVIEETSDFINKRLEVVSTELSQVDLTAETIKKDNRLTSLESQSSIYLQSERDIENQQAKTSTQLQLIDYMQNYLEENNSPGDLLPANMSFEENSINETTRRHNELVLQRNRILKNSSEINPVVISLNEQINNLKQSLNTSLRNIESSNLIQMDALNREDKRISSKIYSAPKKERQFRDLNRQQNIKESLYLYLLQKREEAAISNGISSPTVTVVNSAYASSNPVSPKTKLIYIAAFIFGLAIPTLIIYIVDFLDNKIHNGRDIKNLTTIPLLGEIPKSKTKENLVKKVDYSPLAEAFRLIRTNIDFLLSGLPSNKGKVIFVTSTTSQEGKSHTSTNLAKSISFSNKKVLVVETDIRVPKANKYLNVDNKVGLTDYLVNENLTLSEVTNKVDSNLYMIACGTKPPNPAELLLSNRMNILFEKAKMEYDYIVVDTSAIGLVTDAFVIGHHANLTIFVVRANSLDKRQLSIAQTAYDEKRLPKMTILLNGVTSRKGYGYGYGYGSDPKEKKSKWKFI